MNSTPELRRKYRQYRESCNKQYAEYENQLSEWNNGSIRLSPIGQIVVLPCPARPPSIPFPDELIGLTCGAKTRSGTPCKLTSLYMSGRCKFHGGMSTGRKVGWQKKAKKKRKE